MERRLARGLDALLGKSNTGASADRPNWHVEVIDVERVVPNPHQPRRTFIESELEDLAASIAENGLLQPIVVRRFGDGFQLVAGERRLRAFKKLGKPQIPAVVRSTDRDEQLVLALIENLQRSDLNPIEEAAAYRQLLRDFGLTHDEVGKRVGKSRTTVTNTMRLLDLPEDVRVEVSRGTLSAGHARCLLSVLDTPLFGEALREIKAQGLSVRQTEELVREMLARGAGGAKPGSGGKGESERDPKPGRRDATLVDLEDRLRGHLGLDVRVRPDKSGYTVEITCESVGALNSLVERLAQ